ncbi:MAG: hypothetical protein LBN27_06105 [Prevotellaceae bacterium]|jgi:hypothetical protein|nr:hypothetical protein [Prevotellaceae bacterium]
METAGITIERTLRGKPRFAHIDLKRYGNDSNLTDFFNHNGVELNPIKLTAKLKEAMWQVDNGQWVSRSLDDVLNL